MAEGPKRVGQCLRQGRLTHEDPAGVKDTGNFLKNRVSVRHLVAGTEIDNHVKRSVDERHPLGVGMDQTSGDPHFPQQSSRLGQGIRRYINPG